MTPPDAQILLGNALRLLLDVPSASVDALITDPPYSSGGLHMGSRSASVQSKYCRSDYGGVDLPGFSGDARSYAYWMTLWLSEALRVVKPGGVACLFTDWRQLPATTDALQGGGWTWRGIVPWAKTNSRPQLGRFRAQCEYVVWGTNGARPIEGAALPGFFQDDAPRKREHVTQKPIGVMRELVQIVPPGGVVLDPFAGAGTTAEACVLEGRRCIGFEIEPHFADVATRRVAAVGATPTLFNG